VSTASAVAFLLALAATLGASEVLVWGLSRLGVKLGLAAGLLGLLTALGADAPEISSASTALLSDARAVMVGVILGSNLFNLAALLGLPGILSGPLSFPRMVPLVDGGVNLLVTLVAAGLLLGMVPARSPISYGVHALQRTIFYQSTDQLGFDLAVLVGTAAVAVAAASLALRSSVSA
jgi:Ca2+/Na+ antiporter